jgi:acetyl esterase/lipase
MYTCRQGANAGSVFVEALLRIRRRFINAEVKKGVPAGRCVQNSRRQYALSKKEESDFNVERYSDSAYLIGNGKSESVIFYVHGGAYWHDPNMFHFKFLKELTAATGIGAVFPVYPKCPAYTCDDVFNMLLPLLERVLSQYECVILMGDSAGAGIAQSLVQLLAASGGRMPRALVLLSPCADLTFDSPEVAALKRKDAMLNIAALKEKVVFFAGRHALTDPMVSPLFGSYASFPPTYIFTSTHDLLYGDAQKIVSKLQAQRCGAHLYLYPAMPHTFMLLPMMRQGGDARAKIALIVKDVIEKS